MPRSIRIWNSGSPVSTLPRANAEPKVTQKRPFRHKKEPMFCVQYHPEAGPGPHDPFYLFARFRSLITDC